MSQVGVLAVLTMNAINNLTNVVIVKLGKLVHKLNCSHDFYFHTNHNIIIVQVKSDTLLLKENKLPILDITGFFCFNSNVPIT